MTSEIEWTDETWNPLTGCEYASPGCTNCYAAREAGGRLSGHPAYAGLTYLHPPSGARRFTGEVRVLIGDRAKALGVPDRLDQPTRWRKPRKIFVNSMSDLFHKYVDEPTIEAVVAQMRANPRHTFQVLTKRPQRMHHLIREVEPMPNVLWGASIESDAYVWRADHLRMLAHYGHRVWISAEPLLGPLPSLDLTGIDWLVAGGESGPNARPMLASWARDLRDRCAATGVPYLFKQWGEWAPDSDVATGLDADESMTRLGKKAAGRALDGVLHDGYPA